MFWGIKELYRYKYLIVVILTTNFITLSGCLTDNIDCSRFREGHYYLKSHSSKDGYNIDRFKNTQIETVVSSGTKSLWSVTWIDNCTYQVKYMHDLNDSSNIDSARITLPSLIFKIKETNPTYYIFECRVDSLNFQVKDTMWIRQNKDTLKY
jgi:uncharacterized protein (DUF2141 family)